tara:strand:- start:30587 stop:32512 length:1926 start_codon:yes stop_codon:yes gene_type:complete
MQFKHPELLYALFLLLIPILIHLFQLRRFQKVAFTNVAFLKKVSIQTRKSSQLKKWFILLLRLLAIAALVIAFAEPFKASKIALDSNKETIVYLDNSFSMEANGANGTLLNAAVQDLVSQIPLNGKIHWFTNTNTYRNASAQQLKKDLLKLTYSQKQLSANEVLLKAEQIFSDDAVSNKRLIYISDFQQKEEFPELKNTFNVDAVHLKAIREQNIAIDTAYVISSNGNNTALKVRLSAKEIEQKSVSVSLYNGALLSSKVAVDFSQNKSQDILFSLENKEGFKGSITIPDPSLSYDNSLYFSINKPSNLKVLSINTANQDFLQRMFKSEGFIYTSQSANNINYSIIPKQNCIVLNELKNIPTSLINALREFSQKGGSLLIIPANNAELSSYNKLLATLDLGELDQEVFEQRKITRIAFDHPLYLDVFEKRIANFQFPKTNSFYTIISKSPAILAFEDAKPFLLGTNNSYIATAAFNKITNNFSSSPLIVPTLYNIARQSLQTPKLYYTIDTPVSFAVGVALAQDEILNIRDSIVNFIPLQQTKANKVIISTTENPIKSGTFTIENGERFIKNISYNYSRDEGKSIYVDAKTWKGVTVHKNITSLFDAIANENKITDFWKWFALLALLFLIAEMLVLKFYRK